jgi:transposase
MAKVWLYGYALGVTSSRRSGQRISKDLALRKLAGGLEPDYWAFNEFGRKQARGNNDVFVQVLEMA